MSAALWAYLLSLPVAYVATVRWALNDMRRSFPLDDCDYAFAVAWALPTAPFWPIFAAWFGLRKVVRRPLVSLGKAIDRKAAS